MVEGDLARRSGAAHNRRMAAIEVRELTKAYGAEQVVRDLTFDVEAGSVTALLGPNGAGKTTTMRLLLGLVRPTHGTATILGSRYERLDRPACRVGALLDGAGAHPGRSARDHLRALAALAGLPPTRVDAALALVGLEESARTRAGKLSLGMRQRLGLAAALLGDPEVLVLDEPANGLDPEGIRWLRGFLRSLADEGRIVLVSTHLLAEVAELADRALIMARGRLVADSRLESLLAGSAVRVRTTEPARLAALLGGRASTAPAEQGVLHVSAATTEEIGLLAAAHGIALLENAAESSSLEHLFLELTRAPEAVAA
jgi:ABC-2 type transport system ATP-binding protein